MCYVCKFFHSLQYSISFHLGHVVESTNSETHYYFLGLDPWKQQSGHFKATVSKWATVDRRWIKNPPQVSKWLLLHSTKMCLQYHTVEWLGQLLLQSPIFLPVGFCGAYVLLPRQQGKVDRQRDDALHHTGDSVLEVCVDHGPQTTYKSMAGGP